MASSEAAFRKSSSQPIDLKLIAETLYNIIINSFGPKCKKTLITSSTGQVLVTSDGFSILTSISLSHPIAKCIVDSVKCFANIYGDGSKTIIIYLQSLLSAIELEVKKIDSNMSECQNSQRKSAVSKCLCDFMDYELPQLFLKMTEYFRGKNKYKGEGKKVIQLIVKSFLMGKLPVEAVDHLADVVTTYLLKESDLHKSVQMARQGFGICVHTIPRQAYMSSYVSDGIFFQGQLHGIKYLASSSIKFILLQCQIEGNTEEDSNEAVKLMSDKSANAFLVHRGKVVNDFVAAVKGEGVTLILTLENVSDYIIQTCLKLKVSIISCVDPTDIEYLADICGKFPVTSVYERLSEKNILFAASCKIMSHIDRPLVRILFDESSVNYGCQSLFLCAPTVELCQHIKSTVKRCVKVVEHCLLDSHHLESKFVQHTPGTTSTSIFLSSIRSEGKLRCEADGTNKFEPALDPEKNSVAGGGYFEYLLSHFIEIFSQQTDSSEKKFACNVLVKMLQALPHVLYNNSVNSFRGNDHRYLSAHQEIMGLIAHGSVAGFDSQGRVCNPLQNGIVEVLSIKFAAVYSSLNLVTMLLKVDSIMGAKKANWNASDEITDCLEVCE